MLVRDYFANGQNEFDATIVGRFNNRNASHHPINDETSQFRIKTIQEAQNFVMSQIMMGQSKPYRQLYNYTHHYPKAYWNYPNRTLLGKQEQLRRQPLSDYRQVFLTRDL